MNMVSSAQAAYVDRLDAIEAEKLAALSAPGANAERLNVLMLRKCQPRWSSSAPRNRSDDRAPHPRRRLRPAS